MFVIQPGLSALAPVTQGRDFTGTRGDNRGHIDVGISQKVRLKTVAVTIIFVWRGGTWKCVVRCGFSLECLHQDCLPVSRQRRQFAFQPVSERADANAFIDPFAVVLYPAMMKGHQLPAIVEYRRTRRAAFTVGFVVQKLFVTG